MNPHGSILLEIDDLCVDFVTEAGIARAVDGVSFGVDGGEIVAVVGESGSGKSTLARAIVGILPAPEAQVCGGTVRLRGTDLLSLSERDRRRVRGRDVSFVPQDPLAALNPVRRVGHQVGEMLQVHRGHRRGDAWREAVALLEQVGIPDAAARARDYPHRLSGGMRQRVVIAMALATEPVLIMADEPSTALDATIQAQIVDLLGRLCRERAMGLVLITHDLGLVADIADRVLVMYAGRTAEHGPAHDLYADPLHPYTRLLLAAAPRIGAPRTVVPIAGAPPSLLSLPDGCAFHPRCPHADARCRLEQPPARTPPASNRVVSCHHAELES